MDFETEKLLAKISGENVENFAEIVMSDTDKKQIDFAFEQMFGGLSLIQWKQGGVLVDAWHVALDKMRDFIFGLSEKNYITDYLRVAVFDFRKHKSQNFCNSVHGSELFQSGPNDDKLEQGARERVQNGIDIIMNILSSPKTCAIKQNKQQNVNEFMQKHENEREYENERIRK